ncbi:uncharacterized protein LOC111384093 isoform X9 [Olea europaea subsp. europaea]|uniref:Uncharacterized protein LOC111384093 isoform X9 n=1 Tax=Olea europaea subsp. europaea TaxID=158383 RepID=A0A8S0TZ13_OLEEU|nr:uncharacterized protein LOC111384093 isoform X9 [Olea europaea subsp. europaea]
MFLRYEIQRIDRKILHVGHELWKEALPLQMGSRLYELKGLKPHSWYEVKISYPASQGLHVLLNVESEGVVAIPGKQERKFVIFNIDA